MTWKLLTFEPIDILIGSTTDPWTIRTTAKTTN